MRQLTVALGGRSYKILIERGLIRNLGEFVKAAAEAGKVVLVTDSNVMPLYADEVKCRLGAQGIETHVICIPPGEESKNIATLEYIYNELANSSVTREDTIFALGGGVVGDIAGFAAATMLRGIKFIQAPTTLLAQVDSSVGGKTAINLKNGKNLVGAIYQPSMTLIDPDLLATLSGREFACGMAEVIKYGLIKDKALFGLLESAAAINAGSAELEHIIYTCCDIKRRLVEIDEHDKGERMLLNFGHTLGHVYEKAYDYKLYTHGEAVAAGMAAIAELGAAMGIMDSGMLDRIVSELQKYSLPVRIEADAEEYRRTLALDKKSSGEIQRIVLLREIGDAFVQSISKKEMLSLIERGIK